MVTIVIIQYISMNHYSVLFVMKSRTKVVLLMDTCLGKLLLIGEMTRFYQRKKRYQFLKLEKEIYSKLKKRCI